MCMHMTLVGRLTVMTGVCIETLFHWLIDSLAQCLIEVR